MTPDSQYKLLWIINVMTLPASFDEERYYYDGELNDFFYTSRSATNPAAVNILNFYDLRYVKGVEGDLAVRLELIGDETSSITELPRLTVSDKIGIQLSFLSQMPKVYHLDELVLAVEKQTADHKFVFDDLLGVNEHSIPLVPYWEDFKFQAVISFLQVFAKAIAIDLDIFRSG